MQQYTAEQVKAATLEYFHGDELATQVFVTKYALQDDNSNYLELTPDDMHHRLAKEFARIEATYVYGMTEEEIYELLKQFKYVVPAGSPMAGIGNNSYLSSLSNCTVVASPEDSIGGIFDTAKDMANLSKMRSGVGLDLSSLRPEGTKVNNSSKTSTGAWSFADFYSNAIRVIGQMGRRGALLISMDIRHPDVEKFITMKQDLSKVVGANISVRITDDFMIAVKEDKEYVLKFPVDSDSPSFTKTVKAKQLWNLVVESATKTAEPGVLFWDTICKNLPAHEYEQFKTVTTNPCVAGDTLVYTPQGYKYIKALADIKVYFDVLSVDVDLRVSYKKARAIKTKENAELLKIAIETPISNPVLKVTPDHKIWSESGKQYKEAKDVAIGESVYCLDHVSDTGYHVFCFGVIREIEKIDNEDVYDLQVEDNHNFFANGILVHNCGELPLSANKEMYDCCRLLSLNLKSFVTDPFGKNASFDYDKFADVVQKAQRLCDDLVDLEAEKIQNILQHKKNDKDETALWSKLLKGCLAGRRTGLGITALADALACLRLRYDSEEAVATIDKIFKTLRDNAYTASVVLAEERGKFSCFDWQKEKDNAFIKRLPMGIQQSMQSRGRRNISTLTCAPNGSLSILTQTSSGVEPVFRNAYMRRRKLTGGEGESRVDFTDASGDKWQEYIVYHKNSQEYIDKTGDKDLPDFFVEANDIDWQKRVQIQATMQKYIDHSISSTINLPKGTKPELVDQIYMTAYDTGCKGITCYVDGSRTGVLLETKENNEQRSNKFEVKSAFKRPKELDCSVYHPTIDGTPWLVIVGEYQKQPYEVFAGLEDKIILSKKFKAGKLIKRKCSDNRNCYDLVLGEGEDEIKIKDIVSMFDNPSEATSTRMISLSLRHGVSPLFIAEQLQKEAKDSSLFSFSKVIARTLKKYIKDGEKAASDKVCLNCGKDAVIYESGCQICKSCGYSKC